MASRCMIADPYIDGKLDRLNLVIWQRKILSLLNDLRVLETLATIMSSPVGGDSVQHHLDQKTHDNQIEKDRYARFIMLSSLHNDLI